MSVNIVSNSKTQKEKVLAFLQAGNGLSAIVALREFGVMRLAAVIHSLRKEGYEITSETCRTFTGKNYVKYWLTSQAPYTAY